MGGMLIRRETPADIDAVRAVHTAAFAAFAPPGGVPVEPGLVDALRVDEGWLPRLSLVAEEPGGGIVGHVVCSRGRVDDTPALGLGPLGVLPRAQRRGVGHALMHAVLAAADALDEPLVALLGHIDYYPRFGFRPAAEYGIAPPVADWETHFQVRALAAYDPSIRGTFHFAGPFGGH